jgi:hypothetical protein
MLLNFSFEHNIRKVKANQVGLKLKGTYKLVVHADDANPWGDNIYTIMKNIQAVIDVGKQAHLEVNI